MLAPALGEIIRLIISFHHLLPQTSKRPIVAQQDSALVNELFAWNASIRPSCAGTVPINSNIGGISMNKSTSTEVDKMQALMAQIFDLSLAMAGFSCAVYAWWTSRVPLLIAFVPIGKVTREAQPMTFWAFMAMSLLLGSIGVAKLIYQSLQHKRR